MPAANINTVTITGNLTADPEVRALANGTTVCHIRVAVNENRKIDGEWVNRPNYFDVVAWGKQGEAVAKHLSKGHGIAVAGRLSWREWTTQDGSKRQRVDIIASTIQFLAAAQRAGNTADGPDNATGGHGHADVDDIPF